MREVKKCVCKIAMSPLVLIQCIIVVNNLYNCIAIFLAPNIFNG